MTETATDPMLEMIRKLRVARETGQLVTLAAIVVYADGASQMFVGGERRPRDIVFEAELLKATVLRDDMEGAK